MEPSPTPKRRGRPPGSKNKVKHVKPAPTPPLDQPYHGWKNYETWNVVLWLGNDPKAYQITWNQIVFNVTQQHKSTGQGYGRALESSAQRAFGSKTPDDVELTPAKTKVDWEDAVRFFADDIQGLETEWLDVLERLPKNAQGGFVGIVGASEQFRKRYYLKEI